MVIAFLTGLLFDYCVSRGVLPQNTQQIDLPLDFQFWPEARKQLAQADFSLRNMRQTMMDGLVESEMVLRWILFGVLLVSLVRAAVSPEAFTTYLGPTLIGLGVTIVVVTILEVCSEGSTPIAADILNRAGAPGNSFAFLMGGCGDGLYRDHGAERCYSIAENSFVPAAHYSAPGLVARLVD